MRLVGFLDDDPAKKHRLMAGCRILGSSEDLEILCPRFKVTDVMICAKSINPLRRWELYRRCEAIGVKVHMLPTLEQVLRAESELPLPVQLPPSFARQRG
jgi:FlaA1/EpsC-like NDP-sugar epimerase